MKNDVEAAIDNNFRAYLDVHLRAIAGYLGGYEERYDLIRRIRDSEYKSGWRELLIGMAERSPAFRDDANARAFIAGGIELVRAGDDVAYTLLTIVMAMRQRGHEQEMVLELAETILIE